MGKERYRVIEYDYEVNYDAADSDLRGSDSRDADLSEAIAAYQSDHWDKEDWDDKRVILYPADWDKDIMTAVVTYTDIVIEADNPRHLYWLEKAVAK